MNPVELLSDRIAAAHLERRRNRELQRQGRIFNAKVRTIGIDKSALDHQVREKRDKEETEDRELQAYANDLVRSDHVACLLDRRQRRDAHEMEEAIVRFRQTFQQPSSRREFYLNDPDWLKSQEGVQLLPGLTGEDPGSEERRRRQQEQFRAWSLQQQHEREEAKQQLKQEEGEYNTSRVLLDRRALELQKTEEESRRRLAVATKDFNRALAAEKADRRVRERCQEEENDRADALNQLQGALLREEQVLAGGVLGRTRVHRDCYRGPSPRQRLCHVQEQQEQAQEQRRARLSQQQEEQQQDRVRVESAHAAILLERQQARLNKELRRALDSTNAQLAQARRDLKRDLEKVDSNVPEESFFSQFNTTTR